MMIYKLFTKFINFISRWSVIIPMLLLFIFVIFLYNQNINIKKEQTKLNLLQKVKANSTLKNIDLKNESVCKYSSKDASISAYIKSKRIFLQNTDKKNKEISYLLISGDCLYRWPDKGNKGEKTCGVSSFINIADNLIKFGLINPEILSNQFINLDNYIGMNINTSEVLKNIKCIKTKVPSTTSFEIPKKIIFQEVTPTENQNK